MNYYTPLTEVVDEYIRLRGGDSPQNFLYYMAHAKRGLDLFHREVDGVLKVAALDVEANGTARIPDGAIKIAKIFILGPGGTISYLTEYDGIYTFLDGCGDQVGVPSITQPFTYNSWWGLKPFNSGGDYGIGAGSFVGKYRINRNSGNIEFGSLINASQVVIEYIGLPQMVGNDYQVHPYLVDALMDYIHHSAMKYKSNVSAAEKEYAKRQWVFGQLDAAKNIWGVTANQMLAYLREGVTLTPKI